MIVPDGKYDFWWLMTFGYLPRPRLYSTINSYGYIIIHTTQKISRRKRILDRDWRPANRTKNLCLNISAPEHRIVMEEWLCRKLNRAEDVHHINGNRRDNKIENLFLCNRKKHFEFHPRRKGWHHTPEAKAMMSAHHRSKNWREMEIHP